MVNEAHILKSVVHPNILRIYDCYMEATQFILVLELIEGGELLDRIYEKVHIHTHTSLHDIIIIHL